MSLLTNEILLNIRKSHKLSRRKLEKLSGFKERTIMSYERAERPPSEQYINFMGLYFDVNTDYIKRRIDNDKKITPFKKTLLMYQDIYKYSNMQMSNLLDLRSEDFYLRVLEFDLSDPKRNTPLIIETAEYLNVKPSCIGLTTPSLGKYKPYEERDGITKEIVQACNEENEPFHNERLKNFDTRIEILEEKGIMLDNVYYANAIKSRNLAKDNYTPIIEAPKLDTKYQNILDLLPYAPDSFLEDITAKLQALKDIQKL